MRVGCLSFCYFAKFDLDASPFPTIMPMLYCAVYQNYTYEAICIETALSLPVTGQVFYPFSYTSLICKILNMFLQHAHNRAYARLYPGVRYRAL